MVFSSPICVQVLPAIGGLVDAVALDDVAAQLRLAHADVDDVGIGGRDGDGADRGGLQRLVGDRRPGRAAVGRLPEAAAGGAEVVFERPGVAAGRAGRSSAARGADAAPAQAAEERVAVAAGGRRGGGCRRGRGLRRAGWLAGANDADCDAAAREAGAVSRLSSAAGHAPRAAANARTPPPIHVARRMICSPCCRWKRARRHAARREKSRHASAKPRNLTTTAPRPALAERAAGDRGGRARGIAPRITRTVG